MFRRRATNVVHKIVWRMTSANPAGEYIDLARLCREREQRARIATEAIERNWLASSFDLQQGVRVSETPMETLPGDLIDEFFGKGH
jgi:hypothetical protein